jgi:hypothetical protein
MIFFYFLKIIFDISTSKRSKKYKPHSILIKKNSKFNETQLQTQCQTDPYRFNRLLQLGLLTGLNRGILPSKFFLQYRIR